MPPILDCEEAGANLWSNESIPESDSTPHINVGPRFQCSIQGANKANPEPCHEDLLWDPGITKCTDAEGKYTRTHIAFPGNPLDWLTCNVTGLLFEPPRGDFNRYVLVLNVCS